MDMTSSEQVFSELGNKSSSKNDSTSSYKQSNYFENMPDFDIINVSKIDFGDDENWLYESPVKCANPVTNLHDWLYEEVDDIKDEEFFTNRLRLVREVSKFEAQKSIDTRTFTRPKKRFTRPSIEKYNEQVYGIERNEERLKRLSDSDRILNSIIPETNEQTPSKPLDFDLAQPTNSYYFENVLAKATEIESFQNMSPPSLVNSMCSSTFANLMESSFIKNDPVLREIRDTDFTETILLQDSEPPMFQSFTESCSSINSDTPESFLKKMSLNGTFRKKLSADFDNVNEESLNCTLKNSTYNKYMTVNNDSTFNKLETSSNSEEYVDAKPIQTPGVVNGTYRRNTNLNTTFRKADVNSETLNYVNRTSPRSPEISSDKENIDSTVVLSSNTLTNSIEDLKKQMRDAVHITDQNKLSYCIEVREFEPSQTLNVINSDLNQTINVKRSSLASTTSVDSLDRMSSVSGSSKGSSKILNMADVDAIVEMQERSLMQVTSTPKPSDRKKDLWKNNFISPIVPTEPVSDSDISSNEDYKSVRSSLSKASLDSTPRSHTRSLGCLVGKIEDKYKKSTVDNTFTKNSETGLHNNRGSQGSLKKPDETVYRNIGSVNNTTKTVKTNLNTMGYKLKGSYTSLKPVSANLPVAPPIKPLNTTTILPKASNRNTTHVIETYTKIAEVPPIPRERSTNQLDSGFVKPQPPRVSCLPRPTGSSTGIPRLASKIPGPKSSLRPPTSRLSTRLQ